MNRPRLTRFPALTMVPSILVLAALALAACAPPAPPPSADLRYRLREEPSTLDPIHAGSDVVMPFIYLLFDGLVEYEPGSLGVRPAIAESWTLSPDGLTYTFTLRDGVRFHNGRPVVAEDVVWSLRRSLSRRDQSGKDGFFEPLLGKQEFWAGTTDALPGAAAPDPRTVVLTLSHPWESFLTVLASEAGSIVPSEVYTDPEKKYVRQPVGTGPYRLESWETGIGMRLARFDGHWKPKPPGGGIPAIRFSFQKSPSTAFEDYKAGNLDVTPELPPGQRESIAASLKDDFHTWVRMSTQFIGMNHQRGPFAGNRKLRLAVTHAIDRGYIVDTLQEKKDRAAAGCLPPGMMGHDPARQLPAYDPGLAARLLAEAGYPGGAGLPPIVYLTNETEGFQRMTERLVLDLSRIGLKVTVERMDFAAYQGTLMAGAKGELKPDLFRLNWFADYPDPDNYLSTLFRTGSGLNFSGYSNPALDALLKAALIETDSARRAELYRKADSMLMEDAAVAPVYWYGQDLLLKPSFKGFKPHPLGSFAIAWEEMTVAR